MKPSEYIATKAGKIMGSFLSEHPDFMENAPYDPQEHGMNCFLIAEILAYLDRYHRENGGPDLNI